MAESPEDKDVDALIADLQATLNKLKAAQGKDVADEDSEEPEPKNLKEAESKARRVMRSARQADENKSEK